MKDVIKLDLELCCYEVSQRKTNLNFYFHLFDSVLQFFKLSEADMAIFDSVGITKSIAMQMRSGFTSSWTVS